MVSQKLYNWLERHFYRDNHPKYRHYFEEWIKNIHPSQIAEVEKYLADQNKWRKENDRKTKTVD